MRLGTISVFVAAILLAGCTQKKTINRRSVKSPTSSISVKSPATTSTSRANNAPTRAAKEDGPLLEVVVKGTVALAAVGDPEKKKPGQTVKDPAVIKAILSRVKLTQRLKANRKPCPFVVSFLLNGKAGEKLGMIAACAAKSSRTWPGTFITTKKGKKHQTEWGLTIPDGPALKALVQKHLPTAVGTSTSDVPIVKDTAKKPAPPAAGSSRAEVPATPKKGARVTGTEAPKKPQPPATGSSKVVVPPVIKNGPKMPPPPPPKKVISKKQPQAIGPDQKQKAPVTKGGAVPRK